MPKMGESITEGTVIEWIKKPGELVELDEALLEIGTDKVDTESFKQLERLRETTLTPRPELYTDGVRYCRLSKASIEELMAEVG